LHGCRVEGLHLVAERRLTGYSQPIADHLHRGGGAVSWDGAQRPVRIDDAESRIVEVRDVGDLCGLIDRDVSCPRSRIDGGSGSRGEVDDSHTLGEGSEKHPTSSVIHDDIGDARTHHRNTIYDRHDRGRHWISVDGDQLGRTRGAADDVDGVSPLVDGDAAQPSRRRADNHGARGCELAICHVVGAHHTVAYIQSERAPRRVVDGEAVELVGARFDRVEDLEADTGTGNVVS
jgi:hypothetical protein